MIDAIKQPSNSATSGASGDGGARSYLRCGKISAAARSYLPSRWRTSRRNPRRLAWMRNPRTDEKLMTPTSVSEIAWLQKLTSTAPSQRSRTGA